MIITVTPEIEQALREQAQKKGTTPELLAIESLRERFVPPAEDTHPERGAESLADFLADHIGVICSSERIPGGAQMSQESGQKFVAGMVEKRQRRRL